MNSIGNSIDDLKYNYTINQIYLLYEKCKKESLHNQRDNAITLAHALIYTSPSQDKKGSNKRQKMWDKYINSLDLNKLMKKNKPAEYNKLVTVFNSIGVPVKTKDVK
jgi:hypothetical protein